ncbi:hypothetical protein GCM10009069_16370 [Algimonas arctica]|uniref:Uncharacterized protein n=1 Tax=Algimonas arctica TaxID=1479486 RepID=A0A8J3CQD0_9PROT|nr:hypothetical protein [Algimonas arctica]GHA93981.1 hypothetical protein GCM10009069_16370 [Algimonas arctica]
MRALVDDDGSHNRNFGFIYLIAGVLYGAQCLLNWALLVTDAQVSPLIWMLVGWLPTILFLIMIFQNSWQNLSNPYGKGTTKRAVGAAFTGAGIANLVLALIFGWVAFQKRDWSIWLLFPLVVCALQGAIWLATAILRRHIWHGITAIGWFVSAIVLGLFIDNIPAYVLALGVALFVCMALPGLLIFRAGKQTMSNA